MTALAHVGGPLGCFGLAVLLVARPRLVRLAGLAALGLGVLLLAVYLAPKGHHVAYVVAGFAGVVVAVAGAVVLRRWPWALAVLTLLLAPARVPVTVGSTEANLLIPLYVVIAAAGAMLAWELVRDGTERSRELGPVAVPLALFVAWSGLSLSWAVDLKQGAVQLLFFYLPFGLLAVSLARLPWRPSLAPVLYVELAAMAVLFAAVGLYQRAAHHVFWNQKVIVGNAYQSFFRVNSLFWDSSIYARFMAVTIVLLAGVAVHRRLTPAVAAGMAALFLAMYFAYSQSALLALSVGAVALGSALWPRRVTIGLAAAAAAGGLVTLAIALHGNSANRATSDRLHLIRLGERVVEHHPLLGAGLGGFAKAAVAGTAHPFRLTGAASHTTPITMLAEQGPLGLVLYVLLLAAVVAAALRPTGDRGLRLTLVAAFAALVTSSLFYNAFFEDPSTWICMALIALATARPLTAAAERPA